MTDAATTRRGSSKPVALLFLAIALGGFVYAALGYVGYQEAQIPASWQQVSGQIVESGIRVEKSVQSDGSEVETFWPKIKYRYELDGAFQFGEQLSRHYRGRTLRGVTETEIEGLKQGTTVTVHYNPDDPKETVLRKSDTIGPMQAISAGLAIGLTCFAIFVISFFRKQKDQTA